MLASIRLALLTSAVLITPAAAQPAAPAEVAAPAEAAEQTETLFQTWYIQQVGDEWLPTEEQVAYAFTTDSTMQVYDGGEQVDELRVKIEPSEGTIGFVDPDDGSVEGVWHYEITGGILVIETTDWMEDEVRVVLATTPEGTAEHQRQRALPQDPFSARARANSTMQMRGMHQAVVTYAQGFNRNNAYPDDLGTLLIDDYLTPDYLVAPWADIDVPEDIDDWRDADKAAWGNENASYVFALPGALPMTDTTLVAFFELPLLDDMETIGVCFDDNHVERLPYAEADELIEWQTGRSLMGWMDHLGREQIARDAERPADAGAQAEPEYPDGIGGTWYVQRAEGGWLRTDEELRFEFRDDGSAHSFPNGDAESYELRYRVDEARGVIELTPLDFDRVMELDYIQFDGVLILTEPGARGQGDPEEIELVLTRTPEGNKEHQRERAAVTPDGEGAAADAAVEAPEAAE